MAPALPHRLTLKVPEDARGLRIDVFIARYAADVDEEDWVARDDSRSQLLALSRARVQSLISDEHIVVDGNSVKRSHKLRGNERIDVVLPPARPVELEPEPLALDVIYEDGDIVAINKPPGLVVHPGPGHATGTLVHALLAHCKDLSGIGGEQRPGIVHRLDKGTSGIIVAAKHDRAHTGLAEQFAERTASKQYVAFVLGEPSPQSDRIETFYARHPKDRKRFTSRVDRGKPAITQYFVTQTKAGVSRLTVQITTGRTHQIRVHLGDAGWPILGDPVYGPKKIKLKNRALQDAARGLDRQALHASRLQLNHPISGSELVLEAPLAEDIRGFETIMAGVP